MDLMDYALTLRERDGYRALPVLDRAGLRPEGIYRRSPNGSFERFGL